MIIQVVVFIAGILMGTCLILGALLVAVVLLWAREPQAALQWLTDGYYLVAGMMPVALWSALYLSRANDGHDAAYTTPLRALLTTLQGALLGSILGAGPIFLAVAINVPVLLAGFDINSYGPDLRNALIWSRLALAVSAAILSALPLGLWAHYAGSGREGG